MQFCFIHNCPASLRETLPFNGAGKNSNQGLQAIMLNIQTGLERLKSFGFVPQSVLDIGAYEGSFARQARSVWPDAYILMVDAIEEKREHLNATSIDIGNSDATICLLGKKQNSQTPFFVVKAEITGVLVTTGSSLYRENSLYPVEERFLTQTTLDCAVEPYKKTYELMKLDVQGAELDVIDGAPNLMKSTEVMLIELSVLPYNQGSPLFAEVVKELQNREFVLFDIVELSRVNGHLNQVDAIFVKHDSRLRLRFPSPGMCAS